MLKRILVVWAVVLFCFAGVAAGAFTESSLTVLAPFKSKVVNSTTKMTVIWKLSDYEIPVFDPHDKTQPVCIGGYVTSNIKTRTDSTVVFINFYYSKSDLDANNEWEICSTTGPDGKPVDATFKYPDTAKRYDIPVSWVEYARRIKMEITTEGNPIDTAEMKLWLAFK